MIGVFRILNLKKKIRRRVFTDFLEEREFILPRIGLQNRVLSTSHNLSAHDENSLTSSSNFLLSFSFFLHFLRLTLLQHLKNFINKLGGVRTAPDAQMRRIHLINGNENFPRVNGDYGSRTMALSRISITCKRKENR